MDTEQQEPEQTDGGQKVETTEHVERTTETTSQPAERPEG